MHGSISFQEAIKKAKARIDKIGGDMNKKEEAIEILYRTKANKQHYHAAPFYLGLAIIFIAVVLVSGRISYISGSLGE